MYLAKVKEEVQGNPNLIQLADILEKDPTAKPGYILREGLLFHKGRLMLSSTYLLIPIILREFHSSRTGGYSRFTQTYGY